MMGRSPLHDGEMVTPTCCQTARK